MSMAYEVIPSRGWLRSDGARASIYGSVPWVSEGEKAMWRVVDQGWTVRNPLTGQVGMGRQPFAEKAAAERFAAQLGRPSSIGIGD